MELKNRFFHQREVFNVWARPALIGLAALYGSLAALALFIAVFGSPVE